MNSITTRNRVIGDFINEAVLGPPLWDLGRLWGFDTFTYRVYGTISNSFPVINSGLL